MMRLPNSSHLLAVMAVALLLRLTWPMPIAAAQPHEPAAKTEQVENATEPSMETSEDLPTLRQRYGQDATGVRARLGMCRHGHGGHGQWRAKGMGEGHGPMRGPRPRCPQEEQRQP